MVLRLQLLQNTTHLSTVQPLQDTPHPLVSVLNIAAIVSAAASAWTILACSRGSPKLLKRQLFHQALGTALFCAAWLSRYIFIDYGVCSVDFVHHPMLRVDKVLRSILHGLWFVSCLAELHIAMSVAASACRKTRILSRLGWGLPAIWPLSVVYGVATILYRVIVYGDWNVLQHDHIGAWTVLTCFVATFLLYVFSMYASRRAFAPDVVLRRMRNRAMVYPALFLVTGIPTVLRYFNFYAVCSETGLLSLIVEFSEGALNALVLFSLRGVPGARVEAATELSNLGPSARANVPRTVGFEPEVRVEHISEQVGASFRRSFQWREGSAVLDQELEDADRTNDEETEQMKMWDAYVGVATY